MTENKLEIYDPTEELNQIALVQAATIYTLLFEAITEKANNCREFTITYEW